MSAAVDLNVVLKRGFAHFLNKSIWYANLSLTEDVEDKQQFADVFAERNIWMQFDDVSASAAYQTFSFDDFILAVDDNFLLSFYFCVRSFYLHFSTSGRNRLYLVIY